METKVLIIGTDINAYYMSPCYHEITGKKADIIGNRAIPYTSISNPIIVNDFNNKENFKKALIKYGEKNKEYNILPYANRMMNFYWSPVDENLIYDFENDWLSRSQNKGESFKYYSNGINGIMCGGKFNFNVFDSDIMYFGAQDYYGALTTNGGKSFDYVNLGANNALNDNANIYGGYAANKDVLYAVFAPRNSKNRYITISYEGGHTANIIMDDNH